jgi:photosystem II stability/assembly factor-like uncharacterized protein
MQLRILFLSALYFFSFPVFPQRITDVSDSSVKESFRGLSVVSDSVVWVSGTKNTVGLSLDKGKTWKWCTVPTYASLDFRSLYAFDKRKAVIANAGFPAKIFITEDAGANWKEVFASSDSAMFFDGIDFWDANNGIIYGDPLNGKLFLMITGDGGKTWKEIPGGKRPAFENGEASFAASGTTIRVFPKGKLIIASGGTVSRLWYSPDFGNSWQSFKTPILQGKASAGIFSFAVSGKKIIIAGGDYSIDTLKKDHIFIGEFPGKNFKSPDIPTGGYRSCVEFISANTAIATGSTGTDISKDGGITWSSMSKTAYNCVRKSRKGNTVFLCGPRGQIGVLNNE